VSGHAEELQALIERRTAEATRERSLQKARGQERSRELKRDGLSIAQITARLNLERNDPQRPPINKRTVQCWLAEPEK
jgi:hypothetical protein